MTDTLPRTPSNLLDIHSVLRTLTEAALRAANGEVVTKDWLIRQLDMPTEVAEQKHADAVGPLLTVPEASTQLRISRWSIYDLIHKKQLLSVKIGRRRFVPSSELARYMKSLPLHGGQLL